jgi:uncharacterized protein YbjT (DUF2867 family)
MGPCPGAQPELRARLAHQQRPQIVVHISGIGADAGSASPYIRSRGRGEAAVLDAFPYAKLIRPAVMFGPRAEEAELEPSSGFDVFHFAPLKGPRSRA